MVKSMNLAFQACLWGGGGCSQGKGKRAETNMVKYIEVDITFNNPYQTTKYHTLWLEADLQVEQLYFLIDTTLSLSCKRRFSDLNVWY